MEPHMRIHVWGALLTTLATGFAPAAQAQNIALTEHRSRVQIPRTGQGPYVLEVHVPAQTLQGDRFRVSLRPTQDGASPIATFGRVEPGRTGQAGWAPAIEEGLVAGEVGMESLKLTAEGFQLDAATDKQEIYGFSHEVQSPRDAASTGAPVPARRVRLSIPLPDVVRNDLSGAGTAAKDHKGWINLLSVGHGGHTPGSGVPASGDVTFSAALTGTAPPPRLEFDVESGALQRTLARAHEARSAVAVEVRGWDPRTKRQATWKLERVFVKSYQSRGTGARVVIETGPAAGSTRAPARSN